MAGSSLDLIRGNPKARMVGMLLVATGVVLVIVLLILELATGDADEAAAASTVTTATTRATTTTAPPTTTTEPPTTTTGATTTTTEPASTTTTEASTTTTIASTTTTTPVDATSPTPDELVAGFVEDVFVTALAAQDADTLFDHLHPVVLATFGEDTCRLFIKDTILLIEDYVVTGDVDVSIDEFDIDGETIVVDPVYSAPVEFVFQGQAFTDDASFAPIVEPGAPDAIRMTWFTACA